MRAARPTVRLTRRRMAGLLAVATIGGSVPFVLFFEGLARAEATQAAFIQKTLVVWVALLAVPLLHERIGLPHLAAIALLVAGQAWLAGDAGTITFGAGEAMILAATLLWACEVILVKRLLAAISRTSTGRGADGFRHALAHRVARCLRPGRRRPLALGGPVALGGADRPAAHRLRVHWYAALARAQAVDVTAVLVFGAVVTLFLQRAADGIAIDPVGVALICAGAALAAVAGRVRRAEAPA